MAKRYTFGKPSNVDGLHTGSSKKQKGVDTVNLVMFIFIAFLI